MTVGDFRSMVMEMAQARCGLVEYANLLRHATRDDKRLREEYIPLYAVMRYKACLDSMLVELCDAACDAKVDGHVYEIVQALPEKEHEERLAIASTGVSPMMRARHANDHLQFPEAIAKAIESKRRKHYSDRRSLVVVIGGDYSFEDDAVITGWIKHLRGSVDPEPFAEILLVELDRRRVFSLFPQADD